MSENDKVERMSKVWNASWAMRELEWIVRLGDGAQLHERTSLCQKPFRGAVNMRMTIITLTCFFAISSASAQSDDAREHYDEGKKHYDDREYADAIPDLERAIEEEAEYAQAHYLLGESYHRQGRHQDAIDTYQKLEAIDPSYWAYYYYYWGLSLEALGDLATAGRQYEVFLQKFDSSATRISYHHQVKFRLRYVTESPGIRQSPPRMAEPVNLGPAVNSEEDDYTPNTDPTGRVIYFTSQRKGGFDSETYTQSTAWGSDIYRITRTGEGWSSAELLPEPVNSHNNEGTASFSADGQTMVYAGCGRDGGVGSCDLYLSTLEGTEWSRPRNMGNVVNSDQWDSQATISTDGNSIIYVSTRPGGYGGADLYQITRNQFGDWGVPSNMGPVLNTPASEAAPTLSADGKTLYFSSDGHPGYGQTDFFVTVLEAGRWSQPLNMGAPLNSPGNDRYFTIGGTGEVGYFSSDRAGGEGGLDLYMIDIPEEMRPQPTVVVAGTVTNEKSGDPLGAWVLVEDLQTGELIATHKSNAASGRYLVVLPSGRDYSVAVTSDGFFFYSQRFTVPSDARYEEISRDIALAPIEAGATVVLNNVFFETGSAELTPESRFELQKVVDLMKQNPSIAIEVGGHTDDVGGDDSNMRLSHARAASVREFLVTSSITGERVQAKGYGETNPVATNDTEEGRAANRRTEIIILEN